MNKRYGQYSVNFPDPGGDGVKAVDWHCPDSDKCVWTMSTRGYGETKWYDLGSPLTERGRQELLKHFSLQAAAEQLPIETIVGMPPARLAFIGEALEAFAEFRPIYQHTVIEQEQVGEHGPFSDRLGDHISAELVAA